MLRLPPFRYVRPASLQEAAQVLADHPGEAMVLAGGTDLIPNLKRRQFAAKLLVSVGSLADLRGTSMNGEVVLGGGVRLQELSDNAALAGELPGLVEAVRQIANPQIQRQGTLGGTLEFFSHHRHARNEPLIDDVARGHAIGQRLVNPLLCSFGIAHDDVFSQCVNAHRHPSFFLPLRMRLALSQGR